MFFLNDTAPTEIYTLSLHDALPIFRPYPLRRRPPAVRAALDARGDADRAVDDHPGRPGPMVVRSEEHTSELQSRQYLVCRLLLEKKTELNSTRLKNILSLLSSPLLR